MARWIHQRGRPRLNGFFQPWQSWSSRIPEEQVLWQQPHTEEALLDSEPQGLTHPVGRAPRTHDLGPTSNGGRWGLELHLIRFKQRNVIFPALPVSWNDANLTFRGFSEVINLYPPYLPSTIPGLGDN
jgi:hypothetical protein